MCPLNTSSDPPAYRVQFSEDPYQDPLSIATFTKDSSNDLLNEFKKLVRPVNQTELAAFDQSSFPTDATFMVTYEPDSIEMAGFAHPPLRIVYLPLFLIKK